MRIEYDFWGRGILPKFTLQKLQIDGNEHYFEDCREEYVQAVINAALREENTESGQVLLTLEHDCHEGYDIEYYTWWFENAQNTSE